MNALKASKAGIVSLISMIAIQTLVATVAYAMILSTDINALVHMVLMGCTARKTLMTVLMVPAIMVVPVLTRLEVTNADVNQDTLDQDVKEMLTNA